MQAVYQYKGGNRPDGYKDMTRQRLTGKATKRSLRACEKRPVTLAQLEKVIDEIEAVIRNKASREVTSQQIGELVMERLKDIDEVAYVRFASVYRRFKDVNSFLEELNKLLGKK